MSEHILGQVDGGIFTLRLNRPDKKNAVTAAMYAAMAEALVAAGNDATVRVVLIAGSQRCFSAGNDLVDFLQHAPTDVTDAPVMRFMSALSQLAKPVVAAVEGLAIGIGSTLLLHCDLVYAAAGTRFQYPFTSIGLIPEFASTLLLPQLIGHQRAAEIAMLGEPFDAQRARELGLVNAVIDGDVEAHALAQARKLAQQPPNALRQTKALLKRGPAPQVGDAIRAEAEVFMPMLRQPEAKEAMTAFVEKRKPDFSRFS